MSFVGSLTWQRLVDGSWAGLKPVLPLYNLWLVHLAVVLLLCAHVSWTLGFGGVRWLGCGATLSDLRTG